MAVQATLIRATCVSLHVRKTISNPSVEMLSACTSARMLELFEMSHIEIETWTCGNDL